MQLTITQELCELVGAIIGDGNLWTDGSRYRIELTGDPSLDWAYFVHLSKIAFALFGKRPYDLKKRQNGVRLRLQSKDAFRVFADLGIHAGRKSLSVRIPTQILDKGWTYVKWTLRGIMDTDGTLFFSKKTYRFPLYPTLEIRTHSRLLASQITDVLRNRNFRPRPRGNEKRGYHVALYGKRMLEKWVKEIGFSNPRHLSRLKEHKNLYGKAIA
jgi:hypothetical protein